MLRKKIVFMWLFEIKLRIYKTDILNNFQSVNIQIIMSQFANIYKLN